MVHNVIRTTRVKWKVWVFYEFAYKYQERTCFPTPEETDRTCLFHIGADPCEQTDLSAEVPEKVKELSDLLDTLRSTAIPALAFLSPLDKRAFPENWNGTWAPCWMDRVERMRHDRREQEKH